MPCAPDNISLVTRNKHLCHVVQKYFIGNTGENFGFVTQIACTFKQNGNISAMHDNIFLIKRKELFSPVAKETKLFQLADNIST